MLSITGIRYFILIIILLLLYRKLQSILGPISRGFTTLLSKLEGLGSIGIVVGVFLFFIVLAYLSRLFPSFSFVVPLLLALFYLFVSFGYTENNIIYSVFRDQGILAIFCSFINLLLPKILPKENIDYGAYWTNFALFTSSVFFQEGITNYLLYGLSAYLWAYAFQICLDYNQYSIYNRYFNPYLIFILAQFIGFYRIINYIFPVDSDKKTLNFIFKLILILGFISVMTVYIFPDLNMIGIILFNLIVIFFCLTLGINQMCDLSNLLNPSNINLPGVAQTLNILSYIILLLGFHYLSQYFYINLNVDGNEVKYFRSKYDPSLSNINLILILTGFILVAIIVKSPTEFLNMDTNKEGVFTEIFKDNIFRFLTILLIGLYMFGMFYTSYYKICKNN